MKKGIIKIFSVIAICFSLLILTDCNEKTTFSNPKQITVCLVPLDGISKTQIENLKKDFKEKFTDKRSEIFFVESLEPFKTPDSCLNKKYQRLEAGRMLKFLGNQFGEAANRIANKNSENGSSDYYIIGVTNKDISTSIHGKENYGILGLSKLGGNVSVISTYRLRNKKELWKLAMHEFGHGYYNLRHCPNDDPNCIMADAKGGNPHFELKDSLCCDCKEKSLRPKIVRKIIN